MKHLLRTAFHALALSLTALAASAVGADLTSPVGTWFGRTQTWEREQ